MCVQGSFCCAGNRGTRLHASIRPHHGALRGHLSSSIVPSSTRRRQAVEFTGGLAQKVGKRRVAEPIGAQEA
jgi:hypothetical protein